MESSASNLAFSAARFSSNVWGADRRRCMTQPRCLRVLTVGFASPILICRSPLVGSGVNNSNQATDNFITGHRPVPGSAKTTESALGTARMRAAAVAPARPALIWSRYRTACRFLPHGLQLLLRRGCSGGRRLLRRGWLRCTSLRSRHVVQLDRLKRPPTEAALGRWLNLVRKDCEMAGEPVEQFSLGSVCCEIADQGAFGCVIPQLF